MKKSIILGFVALAMIVQGGLATSSFAEEKSDTEKIKVTEAQSKSIVEHCDSIKDNLRAVQRDDSRTRVYLGGYFDGILSRFIMPLNVKLVEENMSNSGLVSNQKNFADMKEAFSKDFISYQKKLEDLIAMDCKSKPEEFYQNLVVVREKRKIMNQDTMRMRSLISENTKLVNDLMRKMRE